MKGSIQKRTTKRGDLAYLVRVELPADSTTGKRRQRPFELAFIREKAKALDRCAAQHGDGRSPQR